MECRTTRTGFTFAVRPVAEGDELLLEEFFRHVAPNDVRFRFLSMTPHVSLDQIHALIQVDHHDAESFLAFDEGGTLIATAMLAGVVGNCHGEVAIVVHAGYKARGIGWDLLHYLTEVATQRGFATIESIESRENHAAIQVERDLGFAAHGLPDDPRLVRLVKSLGEPTKKADGEEP